MGRGHIHSLSEFNLWPLPSWPSPPSLDRKWTPNSLIWCSITSTAEYLIRTGDGYLERAMAKRAGGVSCSRLRRLRQSRTAGTGLTLGRPPAGST